MNFYILLADLVAVVHAAFVAFVVIGFALIIAGRVMRREWSRAFWFRAAHLVAIRFRMHGSSDGSRLSFDNTREPIARLRR
jgi:hypothetical protein